MYHVSNVLTVDNRVCQEGLADLELENREEDFFTLDELCDVFITTYKYIII